MTGDVSGSIYFKICPILTASLLTILVRIVKGVLLCSLKPDSKNVTPERPRTKNTSFCVDFLVLNSRTEFKSRYGCLRSKSESIANYQTCWKNNYKNRLRGLPSLICLIYYTAIGTKKFNCKIMWHFCDCVILTVVVTNIHKLLVILKKCMSPLHNFD